MKSSGFRLQDDISKYVRCFDCDNTVVRFLNASIDMLHLEIVSWCSLHLVISVDVRSNPIYGDNLQSINFKFLKLVLSNGRSPLRLCCPNTLCINTNDLNYSMHYAPLNIIPIELSDTLQLSSTIFINLSFNNGAILRKALQCESSRLY